MKVETGDGEGDDSECFSYENDLQLAAELGKTLLERNNELEASLKQQLTVIEEQEHEIEFLSRQAAALREVNDSRVRIYEQLEISIGDLEKSNQKLQQESNSDKSRIKSLCKSIDDLEAKCDDLQKIVDDLKFAERQRRRERNRTVLPVPDEVRHQLRRRYSIESGLSAFVGDVTNEELEVAKLRATVSRLKSHLAKEERKKEDLETELKIVLEENTNLQEQISNLQEQQERLVLYHTAERLYWANCSKCHLDSRSGRSSPTSLEADVELEEPKLGPCTALVQLKNGGQAYGSQESLQSIGQVISADNNLSQKNCVSLLSELDQQYRAIIEKYETLLQSRRTVDAEDHLLCQTESTGTSPSLSEEFSESCHLSLSSGFSEMSERSLLVDQAIQTETISKGFLELDADESQVTRIFNSGPSDYKQLFEEIFTVLKRSLPLEKPKTTLPKASTEVVPKKRDTFEKKRTCIYSSKIGFPCGPPNIAPFTKLTVPGGMSYAEALLKGVEKRRQSNCKKTKRS